MFGDLLDQREIPATIPGSRAWWVRVASEDFAGRPTTTTGVVCAPEGAVADRPVVVWCHGTTGMGDTSVPSAQPDPAGELVTEMEPADLAVVDHGVPGPDNAYGTGLLQLPAPPVAASPAQPGAYVPLARPQRLLDTRPAPNHVGPAALVEIGRAHV